MSSAKVLQHLVAAYPAPMSIDEIVCELTLGTSDFEEGEAVERAVRELLAAGLLRRHGELLLPTRAAVLYPT